MAIIGSNQLVEIFDELMSVSADYSLLGTLSNPCHFMFHGVESYAYIKRLSSAHFTNPDVYRAQLSGVESLDAIKQSSARFFLLGYDADNEVFAVWNPHVAKQRIGTAASPSFYSRLSCQKEAATAKDFVHKELKNDGDVLLFPKNLITAFMADVDSFFPDKSEYVAMGSKRRTEANAAYKHLVDTHNLDAFAAYLTKSGLTQAQSFAYALNIRILIANSIFSDNRKMFLAYDSVNDYKLALADFLQLPEISESESHGSAMRNSVSAYVDFLIEAYGEPSAAEPDIVVVKVEDEESETTCENETEPSDDETEVEPVESIVEEPETTYENESSDVDYEADYIDGNGCLTRITNPKLIELLRKDLKTDYPRPIAAFSTVEDFYGDRFPNMQFAQWQKLFKGIDWENIGISAASDSRKSKNKRRSHLKFSMVGINVGETITFTPTGTDVTVVGDSSIEYQGAKYSLSSFAKTFMPNEMRNSYDVYWGAALFTYKGEKLADIRDRKESE